MAIENIKGIKIIQYNNTINSTINRLPDKEWIVFNLSVSETDSLSGLFLWIGWNCFMSLRTLHIFEFVCLYAPAPFEQASPYSSFVLPLRNVGERSAGDKSKDKDHDLG